MLSTSPDTSGKNASASEVGVSLPFLRRNKAKPSDSSSWLSKRLMADWDKPMRVAASMVEPVDMMAWNASSCLRFTLGLQADTTGRSFRWQHRRRPALQPYQSLMS